MSVPDVEYFRVSGACSRPRRPKREAGLLVKNQVFKYHETQFFTGRAITVLESPDGARYILVSRDADRTTDEPALPGGWSLSDYTLAQNLTIDLFDTVDNIRAANQDSFQGPIPATIDLDDVGTRE